MGWSVGDLLAAIGVLKSIIKALDEGKGAKSDYQELIQEIYILERILIAIKELRLDDSPSFPEHGALKQAIDECRSCIDKFLKPLEKYQSLSSGPSTLKDQWRKAKWALGHEGEVGNFKEALGKRIASLNLLLNIINLSHVVSSNQSTEAKFEEQAKLVTEVHACMSASNVEQLDLLRRIEGLLLSNQRQLTSTPLSHFLVRPLKLTGAPLTPAFVQRPNIMEAMEQKLLPFPTDQQTIFVLQGMGGIGKSQMAREYARKHQDDYTAIFWVNAKSERSLKRDLAGIARRLGLKGILDSAVASKDEASATTAILAIQEWFEEDDNTNWMVILDNVDSQTTSDDEQGEAETHDICSGFDVRQYLPSTPHGTVLVTTRLSYLARQLGGTSYTVDQMTVQESLDLVTRLSGLSPDTLGAEALVERLGCHPLAMSQAGRYLQET